MTDTPRTTLAELLQDLDPDRVRRVDPARVVELASPSLPPVVEGMLYVRPAEFLTEVYGPKGVYVKLGTNEESVSGSYLLADTGSVFHVESGDAEARFVNSSLAAFLKFVEEWILFISMDPPRRGGDIDEDRVISIGKKLRRSLKRWTRLPSRERTIGGRWSSKRWSSAFWAQSKRAPTAGQPVSGALALAGALAAVSTADRTVVRSRAPRSCVTVPRAAIWPPRRAWPESRQPSNPRQLRTDQLPTCPQCSRVIAGHRHTQLAPPGLEVRGRREGHLCQHAGLPAQPATVSLTPWHPPAGHLSRDYGPLLDTRTSQASFARTFYGP
jgi:hypothetical protein